MLGPQADVALKAHALLAGPHILTGDQVRPPALLPGLEGRGERHAIPRVRHPNTCELDERSAPIVLVVQGRVDTPTRYPRPTHDQRHTTGDGIGCLVITPHVQLAEILAVVRAH